MKIPFNRFDLRRSAGIHEVVMDENDTRGRKIAIHLVDCTLLEDGLEENFSGEEIKAIRDAIAEDRAAFGFFEAADGVTSVFWDEDNQEVDIFFSDAPCRGALMTIHNLKPLVKDELELEIRGLILEAEEKGKDVAEYCQEMRGKDVLCTVFLDPRVQININANEYERPCYAEMAHPK